MAEQQHTPGPWTLEADEDGTQVIYGPDGHPLAEVDEANARLIAAAPALLAALVDAREALMRLPDTEGAYRVTCIAQAEAAITEARGA